MAKGNKPNTVNIAEQLAQPVLEQLGLELWDVRFEKEGANWYLRYFIDKDGGVDIQDCTDFSRAVDKLLDDADPIDHSYVLEVCSPGIERALTKDSHYQQLMGELVSVRLIRPMENGLREFVGTLAAKEGDNVCVVLEDGEEVSFQKNQAAFVRLYADFSNGGLE